MQTHGMSHFLLCILPLYLIKPLWNSICLMQIPCCLLFIMLAISFDVGNRKAVLLSFTWLFWGASTTHLCCETSITACSMLGHAIEISKITSIAISTIQASEHRRPYEPILIAATEDWHIERAIPPLLSIFAVPREHSRKPSLAAILENLMDADAEFIEVLSQCNWLILYLVEEPTGQNRGTVIINILQ